MDRRYQWMYILNEACLASNTSRKAIIHDDNGKGHTTNRTFAAEQKQAKQMNCVYIC